jgi:RHS repeat-associated protein
LKNAYYLLRQSFSILVAGALGYSSASTGINSAIHGLTAAVIAQIPQSDYTDTPGTVDEGTSPQVQPVDQGGLWAPETLASYNDAMKIEAELMVSPTMPVDTYSPGDTGDNQSLVGRPEPLPRSEPIATPEQGSTASDGGVTPPGGTTGGGSTGGGGSTPTPPPTTPPPVSGGPEVPQPPGTAYGPTAGEGNNWEGTGPGGGSTMAPGTVNTQSGNRLTTMPITGWKTKGGLPFGLTLYHNAQDNIDMGWGQNWRSNYDMRVSYTGNTVNGNRDFLTVTYPTGKKLTFTRLKTGIQPQWGATFYPPKGYYDVVFAAQQPNTLGFTLRTPDQMVYSFDVNGRLVSKRDRFNNTITVTYSANKINKVFDASGRTLTFNWTNFSIPNGSGFNQQKPGIYTVKNDQSQQVWAFMQGGMTYGVATGLKYLQTITLPPLAGISYQHKFGYAGAGAITSEVDTMGKLWSFSYDSNVRLKTFRGPLLHTYTYTYNASNTVLTMPDAGTRTDYYDAGVLRTVKDEAGYSKTFTYDADFNLVQLKDERGNLQRFGYNAFGHRTWSQDPLQFAANKKSLTAYNSYNDVTSRTDTRGAVTGMTRDPSTGVVLGATDGLGNVEVTNSFDPTGVLASSSSQGASSTYGYDTYGNLKTVTSSDANSTLTYGDVYNSDKPTQSVDNRGRLSTFAYDEWGRLTSSVRSDGATTSHQYDAMGRVLKIIDPLGHQTLFTYDSEGRCTAKQNAKQQTEHYGYDQRNRLTTLQDGNGGTKYYGYTARGELAGVSLPDNTYESYQYDGAGNQTSRRTSLGQTTYYDFDAASNLWQIRYPAGTPTTFGYDLDGRQISMTDTTGTTTYSYDMGDRQSALGTPQGSLTYQYDSWGRRTLLTQAVGGTTQINYVNEKVSSVLKMPENETTSWTYDSYGRISTQTLGNGTATTYSYDALDRLNSIIHRKSNGAIISSETYQYDAGGNLTYKIVDSVRTDYGYDAIDQLVSEVSPGRSVQYTYDANGNRLTRTVNGSVETYSYSFGDRLQSRSGGSSGAFSYNYDGAGRTIGVTSPGGYTQLTYDYEDRLTNIVGPGVSATYAYNGIDSRVSKAGAVGARTYKRDGTDVTAPVLSDGVATMVPGISERSGGATKFSHPDRLGTNSKVTDASQVVTNSRSYDAFGMLTSISGGPGTQKGFGSAFGYQEDEESGLKLLGHRYYDAATGRFITRDRSQVGSNWYGYSDNNPLKFTDAEGLKKKLVIIIGNLTSAGNDIRKITSMLAELMDMYSGYDIQIIVAKNPQMVADALADADAAILIGHGAPFMPQRGVFSNEDIGVVRRKRHKKGKYKLDWVRIYSCGVMSDEASQAAWRSISMQTFGFEGSCYPTQADFDEGGKWYIVPEYFNPVHTKL